MTVDSDFGDVIRRIRSPQHIAMEAAAFAWKLLAEAATGEETALVGVASEAAVNNGAGLLELADGVDSVASWSGNAGGFAVQIAQQLNEAATRTASALWEAEDVHGRYQEAKEDLKERMASADGMVLSTISENGQNRKQELLQEARAILTGLGHDFAQVIGGNAPTAPGGGGGGG
ncbi:hypothetical protein, partial [Streptomyces sp. SM12]